MVPQSSQWLVQWCGDVVGGSVSPSFRPFAFKGCCWVVQSPCQAPGHRWRPGLSPCLRWRPRRSLDCQSAVADPTLADFAFFSSHSISDPTTTEFRISALSADPWSCPYSRSQFWPHLPGSKPLATGPRTNIYIEPLTQWTPCFWLWCVTHKLRVALFGVIQSYATMCSKDKQLKHHKAQPLDSTLLTPRKISGSLGWAAYSLCTARPDQGLPVHQCALYHQPFVKGHVVHRMHGLRLSKFRSAHMSIIRLYCHSRRDTECPSTRKRSQ